METIAIAKRFIVLMTVPLIFGIALGLVTRNWWIASSFIFAADGIALVALVWSTRVRLSRRSG